MATAITIVASGGLAITEVSTGRGTPVTVVPSGGIACTIVASGGLPVVGAMSIEASQYITRLTAGESDAFKAAAAALIDALVPSGAWARTDGLYILSTTVKANSLLNLKSSSFPLVQAGGLPDGQFTPGLGWTGDGNPGHYLDTVCDPTVAAGLNFVLNTASVGGYVSAGAKSGSQLLFGNGNFYIECYFGGDTLTYWRAHGAADLSVASPALLTGVWHSIRTTAGASQLRQEGVDLATSAAASSAIKNQTLKALGGDVDSSTLTIRALWFGAHTQADADLIGSLL